MRLIATLLIMYFGLLMMQPFARMASTAKPGKGCDKVMCCHKSHTNTGQRPVRYPSTCNTDFCNPFVPCGISIVHRIQLPNFANPAIDLFKDKKPTIKEDITSDYLADCWRPPELS
jgi:hypothetical protein